MCVMVDHCGRRRSDDGLPGLTDRITSKRTKMAGTAVATFFADTLGKDPK
jgi:hypothetical protein